MIDMDTFQKKQSNLRCNRGRSIVALQLQRRKNSITFSRERKMLGKFSIVFRSSLLMLTLVTMLRADDEAPKQTPYRFIVVPSLQENEIAKATRLEKKAQILARTGNFEAAKNTQDQIFSMCKAGGGGSWLLAYQQLAADSYGTLANLSEAKRFECTQALVDYKNAGDAFDLNLPKETKVASEKSLQHAQRGVGESHIIHNEPLYLLARAEIQLGQNEQACKTLEKCLKYASEIYSKDSLMYSARLITYGVALRKVNSLDESESMLRQAIRIFEQAHETFCPDYFAAQRELAETLLAKKSTDDAAKLCYSILDPCKRRLPQTYIDYSLTCKQAGEIAEKQGDYVRAEAYLSEAIDMLDKASMPIYEQTLAETAREYVSVAKKLGADERDLERLTQQSQRRNPKY